MLLDRPGVTKDRAPVAFAIRAWLQAADRSGCDAERDPHHGMQRWSGLMHPFAGGFDDRCQLTSMAAFLDVVVEIVRREAWLDVSEAFIHVAAVSRLLRRIHR